MNANLPPSMDIGSENGAQTSVGGLLRASRLRRNEELRDVAKSLRIRQVYMEAIEDCRYDDLPGTIYAVGFIRAYAELMGLDGEEVIRRFKAEVEEPEIKSNLTFPSLIPEHGIPGGAIVMVGLVIAAIGYGSWYLASTKNVFVTETVPPVPDSLKPLVKDDKAPVSENNEAEKIQANAAIAAPAPTLKSETTTDSNGDSTPQTSPDPVLETPEEPASTPFAATSPATPVENAVPAVETEAEPVTSESAEAKPETVASSETEQTTPPAAQEAPTDTTGETPGETPGETTAETPVENPVEKPVDLASEPVTDPLGDPPESSTPAEPAAAETAPPSTPAPAEEVASTPEPSSVTAEPESQPVAEPEDQTTIAVSRITLRAKDDSYIQVRDTTANQLLVTKLLKQGESYEVPNKSGLSLLTGNAGALEILVDGEPVPAVGPVGAVRRNIQLEVEKLRQGTAASQ